MEIYNQKKYYIRTGELSLRDPDILQEYPGPMSLLDGNFDHVTSSQRME